MPPADLARAIARRQGFGKHVLLGNFKEKILESAAGELDSAGYARLMPNPQ